MMGHAVLAPPVAGPSHIGGITVAAPPVQRTEDNLTLEHLQHVSAAGRDVARLTADAICTCKERFPIGQRLEDLRQRWAALDEQTRGKLLALGFVADPDAKAFYRNLTRMAGFAAAHPGAPTPGGPKVAGPSTVEYYLDMVAQRFVTFTPDTRVPEQAQVRAKAFTARAALTGPQEPRPGALLVELRVANIDGGSMRSSPVRATLSEGATFADLLELAGTSLPGEELAAHHEHPDVGGEVLLPVGGVVDPSGPTLPEGVLVRNGGALGLDAVLSQHAGPNWMLLARPGALGHWVSCRLRDARPTGQPASVPPAGALLSTTPGQGTRRGATDQHGTRRTLAAGAAPGAPRRAAHPPGQRRNLPGVT